MCTLRALVMCTVLWYMFCILDNAFAAVKSFHIYNSSKAVSLCSCPFVYQISFSCIVSKENDVKHSLRIAPFFERRKSLYFQPVMPDICEMRGSLG